MKLVILCGGQGTRLREETEHLPKPLVKIGGRPILWHIMKGMAHQGLNEFVLCLGYKGNRIKEYFYNYEVLNNDFTVELGKERRVEVHQEHPETGWKVTLADTGLHAMTGARVKRVARYIGDDRFMVTYGDGVADIDLENLIAFHEAHGKLATVTGVLPTARFGELVLDGDRVREFSEKPQIQESNQFGFINGGFFVFERAVLDYLEDDDSCILERAPLEQLVADGQMMAYLHHGFWHCMDTYRDFKLLNSLWTKGRAPWKIWGAEDDKAAGSA